MTTLPTGRIDGREGLALVEVLVAVVILFGGITGILRVYGMAVSALDAADLTVASALAAQQQLDAVPLVTVGARQGARFSAAPESLAGYACRVETRAVGGEGASLVEYDLRAGRAGAGGSVRVSTLAVSIPFP